MVNREVVGPPRAASAKVLHRLQDGADFLGHVPLYEGGLLKKYQKELVGN